MEGAKLAGNAVPKFGGAGVHEHNKQVSTTTSHIRKVNAPNLFCGSERPGQPLARASSFPCRRAAGVAPPRRRYRAAAPPASRRRAAVNYAACHQLCSLRPCSLPSIMQLAVDYAACVLAACRQLCSGAVSLAAERLKKEDERRRRESVHE